MNESVEIHVDEVKNLGAVTIVDIRTMDEVAAEPLQCDHIHVPMDELMNNPLQLNKDKPYLLVCAAGVRTSYTARTFRAAGYNKVYSLVGGNRALASF